MKSKICTKCKIDKPLTDFYFRNDQNRHKADCKQCTNDHGLKYYYNNKHKVSYYEKNKERVLKQKKRFYKDNREKLLCNRNNYIQKHKIEIAKYMKEYKQKNKEALIKYDKEYNNKNRKIIAEKYKERRRNDVRFKIRGNLSCRIYSAVNRKLNNKDVFTMFLTGCDIDYFMYYIQERFTKGMSWDNHGLGKNGKGMEEWHIDHIKPCALFNLSQPEEQRKCFHYSNLQPLWADINRKKRSKYTALDK